jgi:polyhydroxyalkanoate synthesis regulator phasin
LRKPTTATVTSHCTVSYAVDMTTKGTPGRMVRIDDATWAAYGELCEAEGTSRADDLRRHAHARVNAWRKKQAIERRLRHLNDDVASDDIF